MTALGTDAAGLPSLFDTCRSAVGSGEVESLVETSRLVVDDLRARLPATHCDEDGEVTAAVERANALVALTEALINGTGDAAETLVAQWSEACEWASVLPKAGTTSGPRRGFIRDDASAAGSLIRTLAEGPPSPARGHLILTAAALAGELPTGRHTVSVPVLFDRRSMGEAGRLCLAVVPDGPPGLYADPSRMALFTADAAFRASLSQAWSDAPTGVRDRCLTWAVELDEMPCEQITDGSLGGALAVGLVEVERKARRLAWSRRLFALDRNSAVSARLGPEGALGPVGGIDRKLEAAASNEWRVVLSEASRSDVEKLEASRARVRYAADVKRAVKLTRRRPSAPAMVAAAAVIIALVSSGVYVDGRRSAAREQHEAALLRQADELRRLATGRGDETVHDHAIQSMLLVAAADLAREAGEPDMAAEILDEGVIVDGGALETLRLDIGQVRQLDLAGDELVASSTSGRLVLADPSTGDEIGLHTEPPGRELLDQRLPTAVASHPSADVLAAFMHARNEDPQRLVYLAAPFQPLDPDGVPMDELGDLEMDGAPLTALAYDDDGSDLLGASHSEVRLFWAGGSEPRDMGACSLPGTRAAEGAEPPTPTEVIVDHEGGDAQLVFDDGRVIRVDDVWNALPGLAPGTPCPASEILPAAGEGGLVSAAEGTGDAAEDHGLPEGELLVATAAPGGRSVELRRTGDGGSEAAGSVALDEDGPAIEAIELRPDGAALAVARDDDEGEPVVEVYDVARPDVGTPSTEPRQEFDGYGSPLAYAGPQGLIATEARGRVVAVLTDEAWVSPGGGSARSDANLVVSGESAFALADLRATRVSIYQLDSEEPARTITFPEGTTMTAAGAMGRLIDINDDGHLLAASLTNVDDMDSQVVSVWNVEHGVEEALLDPALPDRDDRNRPIGVRFIPDTDGVVVAYLNGDIVRFERDDDGWRHAVLREGQQDQVIWGMDVNAERVTVLAIEDVDADVRRQHVESLSVANGEVVQSWDLTSLDLGLGAPGGEAALAFTVPLATGDVLLAEDSGVVRALRTDGSISDPEPVDIGFVTNAAEAADDGTVVVAGTRGNVTLSTRGVLRPAGTAIDEGLFSGVAVTSNHRYAIGVGFARGDAGVIPLDIDDRLAQLCIFAGRDLTRQEWDHYVGRIASYRPLCADNLRSQHGFLHAVWDLNTVSTTAMLSNPRIGDTRRYARFCRPDDASGDVVTGSAGSLTWTAATRTLIEAELLAVVCVDGDVRWMLEPPAFSGGPVNPENLKFTVGLGPASNTVAISLTGYPEQGEAPETLIDIVSPDGVQASQSRERGTIVARDDGTFELTYDTGDLTIRTPLGEVPTSSRWAPLGRVPNGPSVAATTAQEPVEPVLGTPQGSTPPSGYICDRALGAFGEPPETSLVELLSLYGNSLVVNYVLADGRLLLQVGPEVIEDMWYVFDDSTHKMSHQEWLALAGEAVQLGEYGLITYDPPSATLTCSIEYIGD